MPVETLPPEAVLLDRSNGSRPRPPAHPSSAGRSQRRLRMTIRYVLLTIGAVIVLFPLYITVVNSLLAETLLAHQPPLLFPSHPQWSDYSTAFVGGDLSIYLRNSAIQTGIIVLGQLATSILAAYAFAFLRFPLRRTLFLVFLSTLMIPFEVTLITNLDTITSLGWYNTFEGLTIPFLATGFGTFLLRQAFLQIPRDLQEAAALDGYGHWRFLTRVAVPLARPSVAALAVFSFLGAWNQYLWPLVVTGNNNHVRTVQIGLKLLVGTNVSSLDVTLAGTVIAVAPLLILLVLFQKQLVRSLTAGAVK
jgi:sn-glycerol 3-phosphate transport system permease protein